MAVLIDIEFYKEYVFYIDQPERMEAKYKICRERVQRKAAKTARIIKRKLFENDLPILEKLINKELLYKFLPDEVLPKNIWRKKVVQKYRSSIKELIAYIDEINLEYDRQFEIFEVANLMNPFILPKAEIRRFEKLLPFLRNFSKRIRTLTYEEIQITEGLLVTDYFCSLIESDFDINTREISYIRSLVRRQKIDPEGSICFPQFPARNYLVPFATLNCTVRLYNCLQRNRIANLKDLITVSFDELNGIAELGQKSLYELGRKLVQLGTSFTEIYPFMLCTDREGKS